MYKFQGNSGIMLTISGEESKVAYNKEKCRQFEICLGWEKGWIVTKAIYFAESTVKKLIQINIKNIHLLPILGDQ